MESSIQPPNFLFSTEQYLKSVAFQVEQTLTIAFNMPVYAVGVNFAGVGFGFTLTLTSAVGSTSAVYEPTGGILFFSSATPFTSIQLGPGIFAIDNLVVDTEPPTPTPQETLLTVAATNTSSGVTIAVNPADNNGAGTGKTQFTRLYNGGTTVTLTAPSPVNGKDFLKWQRNGVDHATTVSTNVTMDADYTMMAVYGPRPEVLITRPTETFAGGPEFDLFLLGSNFVSGATLRWNGAVRSTVVLNSRMVRSRILQSDITEPDTVELTVVNPGDVASNGVDFTITSVPPFLCCTNPTSAVTGSGELTLVVYGDNFLSGSTAHWNGSVRPTRFVDVRNLEITIPESDLTAPGVAHPVPWTQV